MNKLSIYIGIFLALNPLNIYALEPSQPTQRPQFERLLVLDMDAKHTFTIQELYKGLDGFVAEQIPTREIPQIDVRLVKNTFKDTSQNTYIGLTSFEQLHSLDSDHNYKLDIYDPLYPRLVIGNFDENGGFFIKKLSDAGIISISYPAVPTEQGFHAKKVNGATIEGEVVNFPKSAPPLSQ